MSVRDQKSKFGILAAAITVLSSKEFLLWLIAGWIVYYITLSLWSTEVFTRFAKALVTDPFIQIPYIIFLISLCLNFVRGIRKAYVRGKLYLIMWFLLPFGIIILLISLFLSLNTRKEERIIAGEGQMISMKWEKTGYLVNNIPPALKEDSFDMSAGEGIFAYEPTAIMLDNKGRYFKIGAYPPRKIGDTYFHILNFGLAPGVRLFMGKDLLDEGYVFQRILPPGLKDTFEIKSYPYTFSIRIVSQDTQPGMKSHVNLKSPVYEVSIFKNGKKIWEGNSRDEIMFDNNMRLSFFQPKYWIWLEAVRDRVFPFMVAAVLLIVVGIPARIILIFLGRYEQSLQGALG